MLLRGVCAAAALAVLPLIAASAVAGGGSGNANNGGNAVLLRSDVWTRGAPEPWSNRSSAGFVSLNFTKHYAPSAGWLAAVAGGSGAGGELLNDVWVLRPSNGSDAPAWEEVRHPGGVPWQPRKGHTLSHLDGSVWLIAGLNSSDRVLGDVWLTDDFVHWRQAAPPPWPARTSHAACDLNDKLYIMGGYLPSDRDSYFRDVWAVSAVDGAWEQLPIAGWSRRAGLACATHNNAIFVVGGHDLFTTTFADAWVTSDGKTWKVVDPVVLSLGRYGHRMVVHSHRIWVMGGQPHSDVYWSEDGGNWYALPPTLANATAERLRDYSQVLVLPSGLVVGGGEYRSDVLSDWWTFQPCQLSCSGHGSCTLDMTVDLNQTCTCAPGWTSAPDCSVFRHPGSQPFWLVSAPWHLLVVCGGAVVVLFLVVICCVRRRMSKRRGRFSFLDSNFALSDRLGSHWIIDRKAVVYNADKPVGVGGFAQVFKGKYQNQPVAVKVIHNHLLKSDDKKLLYMERFIDEAEMMSRLHHPNLLRMLGLIVVPQLCLVTEFAPFGSLSAILSVPAGQFALRSPYGPGTPRRPGTPRAMLTGSSPDSMGPRSPMPGPFISPMLALKIVYQIACGVQCLHSKNITHRDLNTNNVLVFSLDYDSLNVRVADFGLSRELVRDTNASMTGFVGSPASIAPEVLSEGARYNEKADVFSFGVLLWAVAQYLYLATRHDLHLSSEQHAFLMRPYGDWAPLKVLKQVIDGVRPTPPPPQFAHATTFLDLMVRCWDKDPAYRPSFDQIIAYLERMHPPLKDDSISASPAGFHSGDGDGDDDSLNPLMLPPRAVDQVGAPPPDRSYDSEYSMTHRPGRSDVEAGAGAGAGAGARIGAGSGTRMGAVSAGDVGAAAPRQPRQRSALSLSLSQAPDPLRAPLLQ